MAHLAHRTRAEAPVSLAGATRRRIQQKHEVVTSDQALSRWERLLSSFEKAGEGPYAARPCAIMEFFLFEISQKKQNSRIARSVLNKVPLQAIRSLMAHLAHRARGKRRSQKVRL